MAQPQEAVPGTETTLVAALRTALADTYLLYFHAHAAHWNVEGPLFVPLHDFFGTFYENVLSAVDSLAESLRQHKVYGPASFSFALSTATLEDTPAEPWNDGKGLLEQLQRQNTGIMETYKRVYEAAEAAGDLGLSNFIQDRLQFHLKMDWQMRALLS